MNSQNTRRMPYFAREKLHARADKCDRRIRATSRTSNTRNYAAAFLLLIFLLRCSSGGAGANSERLHDYTHTPCTECVEPCVKFYLIESDVIAQRLRIYSINRMSDLIPFHAQMNCESQHPNQIDESGSDTMCVANFRTKFVRMQIGWREWVAEYNICKCDTWCKWRSSAQRLRWTSNETETSNLRMLERRLKSARIMVLVMMGWWWWCYRRQECVKVNNSNHRHARIRHDATI